MTVLAENLMVDGRYRLMRRVGSGGMADVWCAEDTQLGRRVALKVLHERFAQDLEFVERFRREASAAAGLQHPNVVGVFDRGQFDGTHYIAMEYVEGESLRDLIDRGVSIERAVDIARQILAAASFAHDRRIVHRDLKPLNVLVDAGGRARVTDFGIARAGSSEITQTGSVMGTAQYLPPEQAQGLEVTAASDVYSVGVILYEMLTGRVPFEGESAIAVAMKQVSESPLPPRRLNPGISPALEAVVLRALAKDPVNRYATAAEFSAALDRAEAAPGTVPDTAAYAPLPPPAPEQERGRGPWRWILLAVLAGALAALAVWALTRPDQVRVPSVLGETEAQARQILERRGLGVLVDPSPSDVPVGEVFEQDPRAGEQADEGSEVTIVVSTGPGSGEVPDVSGRTVDEATRILRREGFNLFDTRRRFSDRVDEGLVISTDPQAGATAPRSEEVVLFVSRGADVVAVPTVVGLDQAEAVAALEDAGLVPDVEQEDSDEPRGRVLGQDPPGGSELGRGDVVTLTVSTGAGSITVESVIGETEEDAVRALEDQGLRARVRTVDTDDPVEDGRVLDQTPPPGSQAVTDSRVTLFVGSFTAPPGEGEETTPGDGPSGLDPGDGSEGSTALAALGGTRSGAARTGESTR